MKDMVDTRIARDDIGKACICTGKMHLHMAMIFEDSGASITPLSYGQNMVRNENISYHAEHNAIMRLKNRINCKEKKINVFVLKTTLTGVIGMSKPCAHCISIMNTLPQKKGYRISNIFYTNSDGNIEKRKLTELMNEDLHYSKLFERYNPNFNRRPVSKNIAA
jgi:cytidine deaminase